MVRVLNSLLMAVRLEVKSLSDTNTASFTEPSLAALPDCLALLLPALFSRLHPHVALAQPGARVRGNPSPRSTAVCLRNQETSKIWHVTVAVKSALFLQLPLLLAAAINLVEATSVMFESNFVSSFIKQVSAEWLSPGGEPCKQHQGFAVLLDCGEEMGKEKTEMGLFPENQKKEEASTIKKSKISFPSV